MCLLYWQIVLTPRSCNKRKHSNDLTIFKVDYKALAQYGGFSNAHCAGTIWSGAKKRLMASKEANEETTKSREASKSGDEINSNGIDGNAAPATPAPKKRARKPKDPNAPPTKRAKKGAKPPPKVFEDERVDDEENDNFIGDTPIKSEHMEDQSGDAAAGT